MEEWGGVPNPSEVLQKSPVGGGGKAGGGLPTECRLSRGSGEARGLLREAQTGGSCHLCSSQS